MSTSTQSHLITISASARGLRPTLDELHQNTRLLITFRWAAGLSILLSTGFASLVLGIDLRTLPLYLIGVIVLFYNSLLFFFIYRSQERSIAVVHRVAWGQIILDWLAMTALVHFTGGITSPALVYFVIHATLAGTILLPWQARSLAILAIIIVAGLAFSERNGLIPHIDIPQFKMSASLYENTTFITAEVFFFGTAVLTLSELVTHRAQQLRQGEERIRQLYEARSTFLRVATHELRAPLAAGLSLMRNIEQGYAGDFTEQQAAILNRVTARLDGLRILIDDLLTFARSQEVSASQVPLDPVSVQQILKMMLERETPNAEAKQVSIDCRFDDEPGIVMGGEMGISIILGNLLNNAVKYTPRGGKVSVDYAVNRHNQTVEVVVADTGIGIPAQELPNIFNEFFRATNAKSAQITGTGIGLSTVRTLVERFYGQIALDSQEGQGTTVTVTLPLAPRQMLLGLS
jgi:signal transduction histidine kinase